MNKYEIIGIVGEGAYGIVYKARNKTPKPLLNELIILFIKFKNNIIT